MIQKTFVQKLCSKQKILNLNFTSHFHRVSFYWLNLRKKLKQMRELENSNTGGCTRVSAVKENCIYCVNDMMTSHCWWSIT